MTLAKDIAEITTKLDAIGFDIGNYHVSLYRAVLILITLVVVLALGRLATFLTPRLFNRMNKLDAGQKLLGEKLINIAIWTFLALSALDFLHISLTALTVFSGAFGLAIGFGLQKTFGNLISGIILLMDRSIKPGDVIAVNSGPNPTVGQVNRIGIRAVSVLTRDKIEYLIPNELLMTSTVENWSYSDRDVRVKVPIGVAYGSDLDLVEKLILEEVSKISRVIERHPPAVWLVSFGENAVQFEIQLWIEDPEVGLGNLRSELLKAIWRSFKANGIELPYPQRDVHVKEWPGALPKADS